MPDNFTIRRYRPNPADRATGDGDGAHRSGRATFSVRQGSTLVQVNVSGEIDAVNHRDLSSYVERHIGVARHLILDLRKVEFFGSQGFAALCYIDAHCRSNDVDWLIVSSPCVRRIMSICDPDGELPLAGARRSEAPAARHDFAGAHA
jgi:anti-anti-sigma factor